MSEQLTYGERLLLAILARESQDDFDTVADRVLVGRGLAERFGVGQIRITDAGRAALAVSEREADRG
ncbi:MAG: hypothetical protein IJ935_07325 [Afipia sp.]|nr:hypothetical protein [Afipia sp.]